MKLAITIADASHAVHVGGEVQRKTAIVDLPEDQFPHWLKQDLRTMSAAVPGEHFLSMSFSLADQP